VPQDHPLREIKRLADEALAGLGREFDAMYSKIGRPSIPPERLLKACVLMALYSVRSDRMFCEMLDYNILFRWFLDMHLDESGWDHSTFSKNRERLLEHEVARKFFEATVAIARDEELISSDHFSVDGTLIEAWASLKSFRPKDENDDDKSGPNPSNSWVDFKGEKRSNETHESKTDPESRLMRKGDGQAAKLSYTGNFMMENRNGLCVAVQMDQGTTRAERESAKKMLKNLKKRKQLPKTLGADKGYHATEFVQHVRKYGISPHIAPIDRRKIPGLDWRTMRHGSYKASIKVRKRIEELIGWIKTVGGMRRTRFKGMKRTQQAIEMVAASYNLLRISRLATP
jgi:transposase